MKLSNLVRYLNHLEQNALPLKVNATLHEAGELLTTVTNQSNSILSYNDDLNADFAKIQESIVQFSNTLDSIKKHIQQSIAELEPELYAQSQSLYEDSMIYETNEYILDRKLSITEQQREELCARIKRHPDWRWPGLLFRPGLENFIEDMVPLDPLYLVDQNQDLLTPAVEKFELSYQRRLRQYIIDDRQPGDILKTLPDNQFGFVFANMFFNFKPLSLINRYLDELYQKMKPGGILIFTYNDCDRWQGVDLAERSFMCYTPGRQIRAHAESLGFEVQKNITEPANAAWFELTKPGELSSLRGGQALAKITPK